MKKVVPIVLVLFLPCCNLWCQNTTASDETVEREQDYVPGKSLFMLRGYAQGSFTATKEENSFNSGSFVPLFIFQHDNRFLFEAELEFEYEDGELNTVLEYANVSYKLGKGIWVRAGKILVPFGNFFDRIHPSWINPLPTLPLGYGHDGIMPTSDIGVEIRSGLYLGNIKMNYAVYLVNGPQLNDGDHNSDEIGMVLHDFSTDNNNNKAFGGRVGLFPFNDSSLELGLSGQIGKIGAKGTEFEEMKSQLYAVDLTYVKNLDFLKSVINVKGQGSLINVDDEVYEIVHEDGDVESLEFDNETKSIFGQVSLRPSLVSSNLVRKLELVGRYSKINHPEGAPWESNPRQWSLGINYWFSWRMVLKVAYQINESSNEHGSEEPDDHGDVHEASDNINAFYVQWAIGL